MKQSAVNLWLAAAFAATLACSHLLDADAPSEHDAAVATAEAAAEVEARGAAQTRELRALLAMQHGVAQ